MSKQHCDLKPSSRVKTHWRDEWSTQHAAMMAGQVRLVCQLSDLCIVIWLADTLFKGIRHDKRGKVRGTYSIDMPNSAVEVEQ
jgi:hypothetical protein